MQNFINDMSDWSGMLINFFQQIKDGTVTKEQFQLFLSHRNPFIVTNERAQWQAFYKRYFGLNVDFKDVVIPPLVSPGYFERMIIIPKGLQISKVIKVLVKNFECNLGLLHIKPETLIEERTTKTSYAIRLHDSQEADLEEKNCPCQKYNSQELITLTERLIFELKYFDETGNHLDLSSATICGASHNNYDYIPEVSYRSEVLTLTWCHEDTAEESKRVRRIISV